MTVYAALAFMPVFQRKGNRKEVGVQRGAAVKMEVTGKAWLRQGSSRWVYKWEPPWLSRSALPSGSSVTLDYG